MRCPQCPDVQMRELAGFLARTRKFHCNRCDLVIEVMQVTFEMLREEHLRELGDGDS